LLLLLLLVVVVVSKRVVGGVRLLRGVRIGVRIRPERRVAVRRSTESAESAESAGHDDRQSFARARAAMSAGLPRSCVWV